MAPHAATTPSPRDLLVALTTLPPCPHGQPMKHSRHGSDHFNGPATYGHTEPCPTRIGAFLGALGHGDGSPADWNHAAATFGWMDDREPLYAALHFAAFGHRLRALPLEA